MQGLPNILHTRLLRDLLLELELTEPYRDLWPHRRNFTYTPHGHQRENKSRIDFFVTSNNLLPLVTECDIKSKLFDHKGITVSFCPQKRRLNRVPNITNKILKDEDISIVVEKAFLETYLHHMAPEIRNWEPWRRGLQDIGLINTLLREAGPHASYLPQEDITIESILLRENNLNQIKDLLRNYDFNYLTNSPLTTTPDIFYDILLNNVRNKVTGYEFFIE